MNGMSSKTIVKHLCFLLAVVIAFGAIFFYIYKVGIAPNFRTNAVTVKYELSLTDTSPELKNGDIVVQSVVAPSSEISGFDLMFSQSSTQATGQVNVEFKNQKTGEVYLTDKVNLSNLYNKQKQYFELSEPILNCKDEEFNIVMQFVLDSDDMQVKFSQANDGTTDTVCAINNVATEYDVPYELLGGENWFLKPVSLVLFGVLIAILIVLYYCCFIKRLNIEKMFLISSILLGIVFMFVFPPYSAPDECIHMGSAYRFANVLLGYGFGDEHTTLARAGDFSSPVLSAVPATTDTYRYVLENFFSSFPGGSMRLIERTYAGNICQYPFVTLGVSIARLIGLGYVPMLYLGRVFNFAFFLIATYFTIKITPFGKTMFAIISLMPLTLTLMISFSYDAVIITLAMFFIAMVLNLAYGKQKIRWYHILILALSGGLLIAAKAGIYSLICLVAFLIPPRRFEKKWHYFASVGAVFVVCAGFMLVFNLKNVSIASSTGGVTVAQLPKHSFLDILANPVGFVKTLVDTFTFETESWFRTLFGARLSFLNIFVPYYIVIPTALIVLASALKQKNQPQYISKKAKLLFVVIALGILALLLAIAFTWERTTAPTIEGLQGRYFIPFLPLVLMLLRSNTITVNKPIGRKLMYSMIMINVFVLAYTFNAFVTKFTV